jgi:predicted permease
VPRLEQTSLDIAVLAFAMVAAAGSAVLFGLAPALRAARTDVQSVLKEGGRGATMGGVRDRLRNGLIIAELAVTLLLLVGAGLLIRSSLALHAVDPGFEPRGVLSARIALPSAEYAQADHVVRTFERIVEAAEGIAGVEAAAITSQVPMGPGGNSNGLVPEGRPMDPSSAIDSRLRIVTPRYFEAMGVPIVKGRVFTSADRAGAEKVMIISEALARTAFPDGDPIGKRIACCEAGPDGKSPGFKVVVGVAGDVYSRGPAAGIYPEFYLPAAQAPAASWDWTQRTMYVVARTTMDPGSIAAPLGRAIAGIAPGIPLFNVRPMDERLVDTLATARFNSLLLTLLGGIGLILAVVGIYGVLAYFVSRQAQAIGVRMALGATRRDVLALILKQAAWPVGLGIAAGVAIAAAATDVLSNQLFSVTATDPVTFAAVAVSLAAVAVVASLVPAMRIKEPGSVLRNS